MTVRFKNKGISRKRFHYPYKIDIEDSYYIGNKKSWSWWCPICERMGKRSKLLPYKQDVDGHIVVACENPNCIKSGNFDRSINVELGKLLKKQQQMSSLYYRRYDGSYY